MKIAVVGSGPAAAATLLGLQSRESALMKIDVLDAGAPLRPASDDFQLHPSAWSRDTYANLHRRLNRVSPSLVPEKSYMGNLANKYKNNRSVYRSELFGGLTKFWGASLLPFVPMDFETWPVTYEDMAPYYRELLAHIPITGSDDELAKYFPSFYNEQPIRVPRVLERITRTLKGDLPHFIAGSPRVAVRTSGGQGCTYCGHCFYGCYQGSIYSADQTISKIAVNDNVAYRPNTRVTRLRMLTDGRIEITAHSSGNIKENYDRVYLGAGCLESTRIVAESFFPSRRTFSVRENPMYYVPVIYTGSRITDHGFSGRFALSNLVLGRLPDDRGRYVHMQLYTMNPYLLNHTLWRIARRSGLQVANTVERLLGPHVLMMLVYLHGDYSAGSEISVDRDTMEINFVATRDADEYARSVVEELSHTLAHTGFHVMHQAMKRLPGGGSHHYAGTLAMGRELSSIGEIAQNVYIVDSSIFPNLPAQNHTFTIMANALRIARETSWQ